MSLTNDMLLNLEKQRRNNPAAQINFPDTVSAPNNRGYYVTYMIYTVVMAVVIALSLVLFHFNMKREKAALLPAHSFVIKPFVFPEKKIVVPQKKLVVTSAPVQPVLVKTPIQEPAEDILNTHYQEAIALIEQNQLPAAMVKLKNILSVDPAYQNARLALGTIYLKTNQTHHAIRILVDGLAFEPNNISLTLLYARALMMEHRNEDALLALKGIANTVGNSPTYLALVASVQESLQNYAEAISLYQTLLNQDPANARWLVSLGIAYEKNHQNHAALAEFQKAQSTGELSLDLQNYVTQRIQYLSGQAT